MWNKADVPSCSLMSLQLLHFHAVLIQNVADISRTTVHMHASLRSGAERNFSENRNIQDNQSKADIFNKIRGLRRNIFLVSRRWHCRPRLLKVPIFKMWSTLDALCIILNILPECFIAIVISTARLSNAKVIPLNKIQYTLLLFELARFYGLNIPESPPWPL